MNRRDVSLGDWVRPLNVDSPFRIGLIGWDSVWDYTDSCEWDYDEIEPILITPKMLEKWGFQKNKGDQWVIEKKHPVGCCGQTCSNTNPTEYAVWVDKFGMGCVSYLEQEGNANLDGGRYVHQLQHLLRMFGIDKYIKIEL